MEFPRLKSIPQSMQTLTVFGGYRHTPQVGDGEWYDMENLTSDQFPLLAPRAGRQHVNLPGDNVDITVNNGLCCLCRLPDSDYDGIGKRNFLLEMPGGMSLQLELPEIKRQLVNMGGYLLMFPDKLWVNVAGCLEAGTTEGNWGAMEAAYAEEEIRYQVCKANGQPIDFSASTQKPTEPADGAYWVDTAAHPPVLKRWYSDAGLWMPEDSYLKLTLTLPLDGSDLFREGDTLQGAACAGSEMVDMEGEAQAGYLYIPEDPVVVCRPEGSVYSIVIPGIATCGRADSDLIAAVAVDWRRTIPEMDYVTESGNRLWGCKVGHTQKGYVNEIYASKLGDFRNFHSFQGISTDSYVASVGVDGLFTGAVSYLGRPIFFKENCMLQVYGDRPATFRLQETPCQGIRLGCGESAAVVGNVLYYKAVSGVCAFDGSLPVQVGRALGQLECNSAVAGGIGDKYYISMLCGDGYRLFVYDTAKGLWHREDGLPVIRFQPWDNKLYALTENDGRLTVLCGGEKSDEGPVRWMAQSGPIGLYTPEAKYISRLQLRLSIAPRATLRVLVRYDQSPDWEQLYTLTGTGLQTFTLPIRTRRCSHLYLRLEGQGEAALYSISRVWEKGSDAL